MPCTAVSHNSRHVFGVRPSKDWPDLEKPAASTDFKFPINFEVLLAFFESLSQLTYKRASSSVVFILV